MTKIVVLGNDYCPFCRKVAKYFKDNKHEFEYVDSESGEGAKKREEWSQKYNWKTIPMVFINEEFVGGCDDFFKKLGNGTIKL
jgi:glutaredoxin 3